MTTALVDRYALYANYRLGDTPSLEAYKLMRHAEESPERVRGILQGLVSTVIGIIMFQTVQGLLPDRGDLVPPSLWIESPSGRTIREFPFYQGIRIIRKHDWDFAVVEPIRPARFISRREALHIMLFGDKVAPSNRWCSQYKEYKSK